MEDSLKPGDLVLHLKSGCRYRVDAVAVHTETGERFVIYHGVDTLNNETRWARPEDMFLDGRFVRPLSPPASKEQA